MGSLLTLLIFGLIIYSRIKKVTDLKDDEGKPLQVSEILRRLAESQSAPETKIPDNSSVTNVHYNELKRDDLFQEDKWRRQLFLVVLSIGAIYLLYLLLI